MKSKLNWLEGALLLAPFVVLALYWTSLPARVPTHWDVHGEIDSWSPKVPGLLILPLTSVIMVVLLRSLQKIDPKLWKTADASSSGMRTALPIIRVAILGLLDVIFYIQIAVPLGWNIDHGRILMTCMLIFFAIMGNFLGNLRPNYFAGIRTPWTLEDPETWRATHRLGGRLIFFGALLLLVLQFFFSHRLFGWIFAGSMLLLALWAFLYSWHHWRTQSAKP